jgi:plastocyanin
VLGLLAALSTGHKIGLAVVAVVFIAFALAASFLAPRRWPDFPGRHGMGPFVIACFVLFLGMLSAVYFFGKESEETAKAAGSPAASTSSGKTIQVTEKEWKVSLPVSSLAAGTYTFDVHNAGKIPHDLAVTAGQKTPLIKPGGEAKLTVKLAAGSYTLYCTVAGHKQLGMQAQLRVG